MIQRLRYICTKFVNYEWKIYNHRKRLRLKNENFSIIASNCVGTFMYYDMGLPYLSPTINLSMETDEFIRMVENLEWYMKQPIIEVEGSNSFPEGMLGDIRILFVHYKTFEEGVRKWEERKQRINWENLFIVGTARENDYELIKRFDQLPYKNKVIFTQFEYPEFASAYHIKGFEKESRLGVITNLKSRFPRRRYMDDFDYVSFLNGSMKKETRGTIGSARLNS